MTKVYDFASDWFSKYEPLWFERLSGLKKKQVAALEIGAYEGRCSCWLADNILTHPGSTLLCIDPWDGKDNILGKQTEDAGTRWEKNTQSHRDAGRIIQWKMYSYDGLAKLIVAGNRFDLIYVDGNHEGLAALTDVVMSWPLLVDGGWMVFDDYGRGNDVFPTLTVQPDMAWRAFMDMKPKGFTWSEVGRQVFARKAAA